MPADDSVSEEIYVCKDGSFSILGASNLTCVDLPCHLSSHPDGAYDCVLDGQPGPLQLIEDVEGEGYLVPLGAACSLRCHADYQQPVPPVEYRCAYAERAYPDIIYLSELVSSSAVPRMVERSLSGSLQPLVTSQVCMDINCTLPTLDDILQPSILSINCTGISYNSTCAPVCAAGYQSDGHELRCAADGQFQGFLRCLPLPCCPACKALVMSGNAHVPHSGWSTSLLRGVRVRLRRIHQPDPTSSELKLVQTRPKLRAASFGVIASISMRLWRATVDARRAEGQEPGRFRVNRSEVFPVILG